MESEAFNSAEILAQAACLDDLLPCILRRIWTVDKPRIELPSAQLRLCSILQNGDMTMSALSRELGITVSATTQLADRLAAAGLVERLQEPGDRRTRRLRLTDTGATMMRQDKERRLRRWTDVLSQLAPATRASILEMMKVLVEAGCQAFPVGNAPPETARVTEIVLQPERFYRP